jgi:hypothetical protein
MGLNQRYSYGRTSFSQAPGRRTSSPYYTLDAPPHPKVLGIFCSQSVQFWGGTRNPCDSHFTCARHRGAWNQHFRSVPPHPKSVFTGSLAVVARSEMAQVRKVFSAKWHMFASAFPAFGLSLMFPYPETGTTILKLPSLHVLKWHRFAEYFQPNGTCSLVLFQPLVCP